MNLYNTLTHKIEDFKPLKAGKVNLFVCGPTVYDSVHLGHAKTYTQFDILARVLRTEGFDVFYLQNITDIDDKIIERAKKNGVSWKDLAKKYELEYFKNMKILNNISVTKYARATDYNENIIKQVQLLLEKKYAYQTHSGIYFEVSTFPGYGKLSRRKEVKEDDAQSRIDQSDHKRGWNDFCLWKFSKAGEPSWEAPFGNGRPGWHIEDTAITEHFFGQQYDIHGGAVDLIFPHHEAEIAQMESISGKVPFVKYWLHSGFLNIKKTKMSKSKGNFFTVNEVIKKGYEPMSIRLLMLQSHYRSSIDFSMDSLEAAQNRLKDLYAWADLRFQLNPTAPTPDFNEKCGGALKNIKSALRSDLNTPEALAHLNQLTESMSGKPPSNADGDKFIELLKTLENIFGLGLLSSKDINSEQMLILGEREKARKTKDWAKADELRKKLEKQGIGINDTDHGPIWSRL